MTRRRPDPPAEDPAPNIVAGEGEPEREAPPRPDPTEHAQPPDPDELHHDDPPREISLSEHNARALDPDDPYTGGYGHETDTRDPDPALLDALDADPAAAPGPADAG